MSHHTDDHKRRVPLGQLVAQTLLRLTGWRAG
ncbi:MAG TPA: acyl-phosphate glycerol 3-phosphate acyltransferase, partial [Alcanivorax sp.]|nr:acyl-phosphate glycerol 3-phosphate acyltransferase [Alcanivorax sp.]